MGEADFSAVGRPPGLRGLDRWARKSHRLKKGTEMPLRLRLIEFGAGVVAGGRSSGGGKAGSGCFGGADLELSGTPPGLKGLGHWVRWSHRLREGTEMPLRLGLIEFGADVVAGGRSSGRGEAGSGCLGEADFGAVRRHPWLEGPRQMGALVPSPSERYGDALASSFD